MKSILLALVFALAVSAASAHEYKAGSIEIKHPWARATPKGATVAGGYMKIINTGHGARPADRRHRRVAAGKFEIHEMAMDGGVMKMRPLPKGIEIKPGADRRAQARLISSDVRRAEAAVRAGQARQGHAAIREGRHGRGRIRGRGDRRDARQGPRRAQRALSLLKALGVATSARRTAAPRPPESARGTR